jgi:hypothetical protein
MIEISSYEDLEKHAETRFIKCLYTNPRWRYDNKTTMFVYDDSTIFAFSELGGSVLEGHTLLMRLVWTIPSARKKGKTLEALRSLVGCCEASRCAMIATVSPFKMNRSVYDIGLGLNRLSQNQFSVIAVDDAQTEIEGMKRLLDRAGFASGIDLTGTLNFLDRRFPMDRQFIFTPTTIDEQIARFIQFLMPERMSELFYDDELDAALPVAG